MATWTFKIKSGEMLNPDGLRVAVGYAGGNCGKNPEGINNPLMVAVHNIGPLPPGIYTFGKLFNPHPKVGAFAFELVPDPKNIMFGRADFFCHGDTATPRCASEGCVIMPRPVREAMWASEVRTLAVIAE